MRSAPAIGFEYRPSRTLAACIVVLTVLAVLAVAWSGLPALAATVLMIGAPGYGMAALWRHLHPRIVALAWRSDGSVSIRFARHAGEGGEVQGSLQDARVFGFMIALRIRWPGGRAGVWILPDNLDADTRRRLRVRLRCDAAHGASVNADNI